jgi:hypothetical protein
LIHPCAKSYVVEASDDKQDFDNVITLRMAEYKKLHKYRDILSNNRDYEFVPFTISTFGGIGKMAQTLINDISIFASHGYSMSTSKEINAGLTAAIACAVQRGNLAIMNLCRGQFARQS